MAFLTWDDRQRLAALDRANDARRKGRLLRTAIHDARGNGGRLAADVVITGDSAMEFERLLCAVLHVGHSRAGAMLNVAEIQPNERVDSPFVTRRQRLALADELRKFADRWRDA